MKSPLGFGLAIAATASLAFAGTGPGGEKKGGETPPNTPVLQNAKVTFKPGKGITFDGGEAFALNLRSYFQVKMYFINTEHNRDTTSLRARRARMTFSGHVWNEDLTYKVQTDFADSDGTSIKDVWFNYNFHNTEDYTLGVRGGIQKMRSGRQADNSAQKLEFIERSIATRTFADARSTGALLHGAALNDGDGGKKLHWHAGIMNTDTSGGSVAADDDATNLELTPAGGAQGNNEINFTFGIRFDPMGEMALSEGDLEHSGAAAASVGANLFVGNAGFGPGGAGDIDTTNLNLQAAFKSGSGISAQGEVWLREDDQDSGMEADSTGWYVQGSYTTAPDSGTQYAAGARVSMIDFDDAPLLLGAPGLESGQGDPIIGAGGTAGGLTGVGAKGDILEIQGMLSAYYHKHDLKSQFVYTYQQANASGIANEDTNHGLDLMFTLVF